MKSKPKRKRQGISSFPKRTRSWSQADTFDAEMDKDSMESFSSVEDTPRWSALDLEMEHTASDIVEQDADQDSETDQFSGESIHIRNSCDVSVKTTDTQAAVNLQAALQLAITLVLSITIADSDRADGVAQDLLQRVQVRQENRQRLIIDNSRSVRVTTTDTDASVNIQVLVQVLLALVAKIDVL